MFYIRYGLAHLSRESCCGCVCMRVYVCSVACKGRIILSMCAACVGMFCGMQGKNYIEHV